METFALTSSCGQREPQELILTFFWTRVVHTRKHRPDIWSLHGHQASLYPPLLWLQALHPIGTRFAPKADLTKAVQSQNGFWVRGEDLSPPGVAPVDRRVGRWSNEAEPKK